jgi:uncharacterized protein
MRLEHDFTVPAPIDTAWRTLLDVPRIAPCLPGATLTDFDGEEFTGTVKVKVGPITITYRGSGRLAERDEAAHRAVIEASGREARGPGTARATVTATLTGTDDGTRVDVTADLAVTGRPAQFGRGMLSDVGAKLITRFADCLATQLRAPEPEPEPEAAAGPAEPPVPAAPVAAPAPAAEPIDLLHLTGIGSRLRRVAPVVLGAAGAVLTWLAARRLLRRRHR